MPTNLDYKLYFDLALYGGLGFGFLFGILKGFKKSIYSFLTSLLLIVGFFVSITPASEFLWSYENPQIGALLGQLLVSMVPTIGEASSLGEAITITLGSFAGETYAGLLANVHLLELVEGIGTFVIKIVYMLLYFTIFWLIYKLLCAIIYAIFLKRGGKDDKYRSKNRLLGGVFGVLEAAVSVYVMLISFSGLLDIVKSMTTLLPVEDETVDLEFPRSDIYEASQSILAIVPPIAIPPEVQASLDMMNEIIAAYDGNLLVQMSNQLTFDDEGTAVPLALHLFDTVLSIDYDVSATETERISFRHELSVFAGIAGYALSLEFIETGEIASITRDNVVEVFAMIGDSKLITTLIPLGIEVASEMYEMPLDLPTEDLYALDWAAELDKLGVIAAVGFDIVNQAGLLAAVTPDYTTITVDGDLVRDLFDSLADSDLVNLAVLVAIEPVMAMAGDMVNAIITVPADIVWADEFRAMGAFLGAVLDTGITMADLQADDEGNMNYGAILTAVAAVDFTLLLDSQLFTTAIINILSGAVDIPGLSGLIVIPDNLVWYDEYDDDGNLIAAGELRNILLALNAVVQVAAGIDFNNLGLGDIALLTDDTIDAIFNSQVLVASLSAQLADLDTGTFQLIIPDAVRDLNGNIVKAEFVAVTRALRLASERLACDEGDLVCQESFIDIGKIFTITGDDLDTLLASQILTATIGNYVNTMEIEALVVPGSALTDVLVDGIPVEVIAASEIRNVFAAVLLLNIDDFENFEFTVDLLVNLEGDIAGELSDEKLDTLFASLILRATIAKVLIDMTNTADPIVVIPTLDVDGEPILIDDPVDGTDMLAATELSAILKGVYALDLDFTNPDFTNIGPILEHVDLLLESAILHATISDLLITLEGGMIIVPELYGAPETEIQKTVGGTHYIVKDELNKIFDALELLEITTFDSIAFDASIIDKFSDADDPTILDEGKLDTMLASVILRATISNMIVDLIDVEPGQEALVVIPNQDVDGIDVRFTDHGFDYISSDELKAILRSFKALGFTDFENMSFTDLDPILSNIDILLDSAVLHATISDVLLDLATPPVGEEATIVIPIVHGDGLAEVQIQITVGATTYIAKSELSNIIDSLSILGITDTTNIAFDATIIENLEDAEHPGSLDDAKLDTLFSSYILRATISKMLLDLMEAAPGEEPLVIVPETDWDGNPVEYVDHAVTYIAQDELENVLKALFSLDITDFENVSSLSIQNVINHFDELILSAILHATISKQILDIEAEMIVVPHNYTRDYGLVTETDVEIIRSIGLTDPIEMVSADELNAMLDAVELLGFTDFSVSLDAGIISTLQVEGDPTQLDSAKLDVLFGSAIIHASISNMFSDLTQADPGEEPLVIVPETDWDGVAVLYDDPLTALEYVSTAELEAVLSALNSLNITDFNNVSSLSLANIMAHFDELIQSAILHATVSKQVLDIEAEMIVIPHDYTRDYGLITEADVQIIRSIGALNPVDMISEAELTAMLDAIELLGFTDFSVSLDAGIISTLQVEGDPTQLDQAKLDVLFGSAIIHASISNMFADLTQADPGEEPLVIVPETDWDGVAVLYDDPLTALEYVSTAELEAVLSALNSLNITDFNNVSTLELSNIMAHFDELIQSAILHATISKQVLDIEADMIVVPGDYTKDYGLVTEADVQIIRSVGVDNPVDLISEAELTALFDAIELLGFTDFSVSLDAGIISTLQVEGDPTQLDQVKLDVLFASAIIHASISNMFADLTTADPGEEPLVIVPETDWDGVAVLYDDPLTTIEYVSTAELSSVLSALNSLGITDFNNVSTLDLANVMAHFDDLIGSAILHATISKQILDIDAAMIVIPDDYTVNYGLPGETQIEITRSIGLTDPITMISADELDAMFASLDLLGFTDFSVSLDATIIDALEDEVDPTTLDQGKLNVLFGSAIIHASFSQMFFDLTDVEPGEEALVVVPEQDVDGLAVLYTDFAVDFVSIAELDHTLYALHALNVTDFGAVDALDMDTIIAEMDVLLNSAIMHATISKQILGITALVIPYRDAADSIDIRVTVLTTEFIDKDELGNLFDGLQQLGVSGDLSQFSGDVDYTAFFDDAKRTVILSSAIMHAMISDTLVNFDPDTLTVPYYAETGSTPADLIRLTVGAVGFENEYVKLNEIHAMFVALRTLGIDGNIENFDGTVDLDALFDETKRDDVLNSTILQARISEELFNLGAAVIDVPYVEADSVTAVRRTVGALETETEYVLKSELIAIFVGLAELGFTGDIQGFTGDVNMTSLFAEASRTAILDSATLHARISKELIDLTAATLAIPYVGADGLTAIRLTVGPLGLETEYIDAAELGRMFEALQLLGFAGDIQGFDGTIDASALFSDEDPTFQRSTVLSSAIIHAKISEELIGLGATLDIPFTAADGATDVRETVGDPGETTEYVVETELANLFEAMELLGFTGDILGAGFTGEFELTALFDDVDRATVLDSSIIHAKISTELVGLGVATLAIPFTAADDVSAVRATVGAIGFTTEYVVESELSTLFEAMELLGFTGDVLGAGFTGTFDLTPLFDGAKRPTVLASSIIHAKISSELVDLGSATLAIPYTAADDVTDVRTTVGAVGFTTEYIAALELGAMFEAMELLGFSGDVLGAGFTGEFDLTALFDDVDRETVLDSSIIHAKISTELVVLGPATLAIPYTAADDLSAVRTTVGAIGFTTEYIVENELSTLFEAMELLGFTGDILGAGFDGSFSLTALFDGAKRPTVLDSSIIHAKISSELIGLGAVTLDIPYGTEDYDTLVLATHVRMTVGDPGLTTEYIAESELGYLFEGLETLGFSGDVLTEFSGDINISAFYNPVQRASVLQSAILQAKISLEMFNLGSSTLLVPTTDVNDAVVRLAAGPLGLETDYITKAEIGHLFEALGVLGFSGDTNFSGTVNLNNVNDPAEQDTLFASATMHATISQSVIKLDDTDGILIVPSYTQDGAIAANQVRLAVSGTAFVVKTELKNLIEALIAMGYGDLSIVASIDTSKFFTETATILASATMQATISAEVLALDDGGLDDALVVPSYTIDGVADLNKIRRTVDGIAFVDRDELEALFTALDAMGFADLDSFGGGISSNLFFAQKATILLSSIMHATISDQLLNDTAGALLVPDTDVENGDAAIRITVSGTEFITAQEISDLLDALDEMGLTNFGALDISIANIFAADFNILVASASMQATISDSLLEAPTKDETTMVVGASDLVVPTVFRQDITVGAVSYEQIEEAELLELLDGLDQLGFTSFGSSMSGTATSTFDYATMMDIMESGSLHVTLHTMLQGSVAADTPDLAKEVALYGVTGLTKAAEIAYFIVAVNTIGESDFTDADFSISAILSLTVEQRGTVFDSMIVRNMLTDDIETAIALINANNLPLGPFYTFDNTDYMESNPALFFTKAGALDAVAFIDSETP